MAGMSTVNTSYLIRANVWSNQIKDVLLDQLNAQNYVRWLTDFPDGTTFNIPSIGQMQANDYTEDQAIQYTALDTGNLTFTISTYLSSGTYITNKAKQDGFYMNELISSFVPKEARAISERLEGDILKIGQPGQSGGQTVADLNLINGAAHRWVGSTTTTNSKKIIGLTDFAEALYSLKKAHVPQENLIAIVDPSTEYILNTLTNLVNVQNNPRWEGIIDSGIAKGLKFVKNVFGFDVYTSNFLPLCNTNQTGSAETINSVASTGSSVCNLFFSASPDVLPFIGAWRQMPKVDADYNKDFQREEYVTTCRYGLKLYRPENLVTVLSDPAITTY